MQNFFIKGRDNPVVINFTFDNSLTLDSFDRIVFSIGDETYDSDVSPLLVSASGLKLTLSIGDVTQLDAGRYTATITAYSALYDDGFELTGRGNPRLGQIAIRNP